MCTNILHRLVCLLYCSLRLYCCFIRFRPGITHSVLPASDTGSETVSADQNKHHQKETVGRPAICVSFMIVLFSFCFCSVLFVCCPVICDSVCRPAASLVGRVAHAAVTTPSRMHTQRRNSGTTGTQLTHTGACVGGEAHVRIARAV